MCIHCVVEGIPVGPKAVGLRSSQDANRHTFNSYTALVNRDT